MSLLPQNCSSLLDILHVVRLVQDGLEVAYYLHQVPHLVVLVVVSDYNAHQARRVDVARLNFLVSLNDVEYLLQAVAVPRYECHVIRTLLNRLLFNELSISEAEYAASPVSNIVPVVLFV